MSELNQSFERTRIGRDTPRRQDSVIPRPISPADMTGSQYGEWMRGLATTSAEVDRNLMSRAGDQHMIVDTSPASSRDRTPRAGDQQAVPSSEIDALPVDAMRRLVRRAKVLGLEVGQIDTILDAGDPSNPQHQIVDRQIKVKMQEFNERDTRDQAKFKLENINSTIISQLKNSTNSSRNDERLNNIRIVDSYVGRRASGQGQLYTIDQAIDAFIPVESYVKSAANNTSRRQEYIREFDRLDTLFHLRNATNLRGRQ